MLSFILHNSPEHFTLDGRLTQVSCDWRAVGVLLAKWQQKLCFLLICTIGIVGESQTCDCCWGSGRDKTLEMKRDSWLYPDARIKI